VISKGIAERCGSSGEGRVSDLPKLPNCSDVSTGELVELGKSDTFPILFGFEVDEKLLPFAIEQFATGAEFAPRISLMETASTGAVDVFLKRDDISEESKKEIRIKSPDPKC
jgi:hypothetical protein